MLAMMSWFVPLLRELPEMRYQWTEPYLVDDRRFRSRFQIAPTPIEQGAAATVTWARAAFGARR
jgi:hypothetical protein